MKMILCRRGIKIALILIPVYGLQSFVLVYRPKNQWYSIVESCIIGTQGAVMAIAYCAINHEVCF